MSLPSESGLKPRSEAWMAFSISLTMEGSQGWMRMVCGFGRGDLRHLVDGRGAFRSSPP